MGDPLKQLFRKKILHLRGILVPFENFASSYLKATQDLSGGTFTPSAIKPY